MNYGKYIDHTNLKPTATEGDIIKLCNEAIKYSFFSVCVNPCFVKLASKALKGSDVKVSCVIGFPLGANSTNIKKLEAIEAVENGASELDMVINQGLFKEKKYKEVLEDINAVCETGALVKVIVETSNLSKNEITELCEIVNNSNALFIKTSTGYIGGGAKAEDVALMRQLINKNKKVKASGGIRDKTSFLQMINAGADRIGTSSGVTIMEEL